MFLIDVINSVDWDRVPVKTQPKGATGPYNHSPECPSTHAGLFLYYNSWDRTLISRRHAMALLLQPVIVPIGHSVDFVFPEDKAPPMDRSDSAIYDRSAVEEAQSQTLEYAASTEVTNDNAGVSVPQVP
ncbi:hypothetical protein BWQ96_01725 [Gracilariopsis chorda]|uniref:Uncharacterized protein n=1 Tax=Gracilariopsis chorda TaxID=448386 RepID=A0A2V3J274_9FLOR|nr:hypothetical protein BWQ96_01725 [Gracilariopsis chorda]|eukprot:PXF48556.1 hypothetical protein BWQ96_01725 [Gracilariopsis chorda]